MPRLPIPAAVRDRLRVVRNAPRHRLPVFARLQWDRLVGQRRDEPQIPNDGVVRVLFVCHGNIMRSALSEQLLRARTARLGGRVEVRSAGMYARDGKPADPRAQEVARELGVDLSAHQAQRMTPELAAWAHVIVAMDWLNEVELVARHPEAESRVVMLDAWYQAGRRARAIADPYTGDLDEVRRCFAHIAECVDGLAGALSRGAAQLPRASRTSGPRPGGFVAPASISVVIPVFNARRFLDACIPSVLRAARRSGVTEIVVVDNGSTDGSDAHVEQRWPGEVTLLRCPGVLVGEVRNVGARATRGELLSFVDADCVLDEDYFERAREALTDPEVAATGAPYALPDDALWIERTWQQLHETKHPDGPVVYLNAGNFVVRRSVFESVGGFDPQLESGEDAELGLRMRRHGAVTVSDATVRAVHLGNPKSIPHFMRKQRWHAMGMFGTVSLRHVDKPTAMLFAHLALPLLALVTAWEEGLGVAASVALAAASTLVVPMAAVLYRWAFAARRSPLLPSLALYWLYFLARAWALARLVGQALTRRPRALPAAAAAPSTGPA